MLEKPDIPEELISSCIHLEYGLDVEQVVFLPLGYDVHTAVYRVDTKEHGSYFLKLRKSEFQEYMVAVPYLLSRRGIQAVIRPVETRDDHLYAMLGDNIISMYPFIAGKNGYQMKIAEHQWVELGEALRMIHATRLPSQLEATIPHETYDPAWRQSVRWFQQQVEQITYTDPVAQKLVFFMKSKQAEIDRMVNRANELAQTLKDQAGKLVLCHSDCHPGNYLIGDNAKLYLVDWDNPILAPRERDLMFFGAGMTGDRPGGREERLFYQGYQPAEINLEAIAYYRYERIIQDMAEFCKQLLLTDAGGDDREQAYSYFTSSFAPGRELDAADRIDRKLNCIKEN